MVSIHILWRENGIYDGYWTGSSTPADGIDGWILHGRAIDFYMNEINDVCLETQYLRYVGPPKSVHDIALKSGKPVLWEGENDNIYEITRCGMGTTARCVNNPNGGMEVWDRYEPVLISGADLLEVLTNAGQFLPTIKERD
jgi:hypothetical protein